MKLNGTCTRPRSGLGLNELLGGACCEREATNCKNDQPGKMLAASADQGQKAGSDSGVADDLHSCVGVQFSLAGHEHKCSDAKPSDSGDVPSKAQSLLCEVGAAEDLGKVGSAKQASEDVPLTEDGVSKPKSNDENGSELQHCWEPKGGMTYCVQDVIRRYEKSETLLFLDPPYWQTSGCGGEFGLGELTVGAHMAKDARELLYRSWQ